MSDNNTKSTNKANDYTPYWESSGETAGYTKNGVHPEFHVYISFQKSGTEREAEHYDEQDNPDLYSTDDDSE